MSVEHSTFTLERTYPAPPARVFAAFADPAVKGRWFNDSGWEWAMDFRVGGKETTQGTMDDGTRIEFEGTYYDIVQDERIVYAYEMHANGERISVSVATIEVEPDGDGARLKLTEQGAFLDGRDAPATRQGGTEHLLDELAAIIGSD